MQILKAHTIIKTGNFVRFSILLVTIALFSISCETLDNPNSADTRDKLIGSWVSKETSNQFQNSTYTVEISKSTSDSTKIFVSNFYNLKSGDVYMKMNGLSLSIPSQVVDGYSISGSGSVSSNYNTINLSYKVITGSLTDNVTAVYTK